MKALMLLLVSATVAATPFEIRSANPYVVLNESNILRYHWKTHTIKLVPGSLARLNSSFKNSGKLQAPFEFRVEGKSIYEGVFTTLLSSMSSDKVVIVLGDPTQDAQKPEEIRLQLGYPDAQFFTGPDPRGDKRIKRKLKQLKKID